MTGLKLSYFLTSELRGSNTFFHREAIKLTPFAKLVTSLNVLLAFPFQRISVFKTVSRRNKVRI